MLKNIKFKYILYTFLVQIYSIYIFLNSEGELRSFHIKVYHGIYQWKCLISQITGIGYVEVSCLSSVCGFSRMSALVILDRKPADIKRSQQISSGASRDQAEPADIKRKPRRDQAEATQI